MKTTASKAKKSSKAPAKKSDNKAAARVLKSVSKKSPSKVAAKKKPSALNGTGSTKSSKVDHVEQARLAHATAIISRSGGISRKSEKLSKSDIKRFKKMFQDQVNGLLYNDKILRDDFAVNDDDRPDEVDQASTDVEQSMRMRLRNRERLYLFKIEEALRRIEDGVFGLCDTCEEPIERRRLEARPTATLCVACKEDQERMEGSTSDGLRHKSLGSQVTRFV